jgi:hypothetical protein
MYMRKKLKKYRAQMKYFIASYKSNDIHMSRVPCLKNPAGSVQIEISEFT